MAILAAAVVQDWLDARADKVLLHPLYSPDLTSGNLFLVPMLKKVLADQTLMPTTIKTTLDGVARTIAA